MKNIGSILIGIALFASANAQLVLYGGLHLAGTSASDFDKFDISDWQNYGLKSRNPASAEGRVTVDLRAVKPRPVSIGIMFGARYYFDTAGVQIKKLSALVEFQYAFSGISLLATYAGVNYDVHTGKNFTLGITPKIGYVNGSVELGQIALIPGYTPPVILPEGTFNVGNPLSMKFKGFAFSLGITPTFALSNKLTLMGYIGYNNSLVKDEGLLCNGVKLPMTAKGVVKSDGLNTQAGIEPKVKAAGMSFQIGVGYKLTDGKLGLNKLLERIAGEGN